MKKGVRIKCEQSKIFQFVTNYRNVNFLLDDFVHFEPEFAGSVKLGDRYRATGGFAGIKFSLPFLVTHYTPPTLMVLQTSGQLEGRVIWEIQPREQGLHLLCLQVDLDLNSKNSPIFQPLFKAASWLSGPVKSQIQIKQQALITNALLKAKRNLESMPGQVLQPQRA